MTSAVVEQMAEAAGRFLESLSPQQTAGARRPFDDEGRSEWYYTPNVRPGLPFIEMDAVQQQHARRLLRSGLSEGGYNTASLIMGLEAILADRNQWPRRPFQGYGGGVPSTVRNPNMYFVCVFGEPGSGTSWGWSFGGHHVSVHHTIVEGALASSTPSFFGADPAEAPLLGGQLLRPLAATEDLGRSLLDALTDDQRAVAIISPVAPIDMVQSNRRRVEEGALPIPPPLMMGTGGDARVMAQFVEMEASLGGTAQTGEAVRYTLAPKGLAAGKMSPSQRDGLTALIRQYIERLPDEVAEREWSRITTAGLDGVHFAWAGARTRMQPHYYRLQGPSLLIEYDNAQSGGNHVHSVWRDPAGDFGADVLARHYAESH
jgi:hypothetical protein